MAVKSIIDVEINDEQFKEFQSLFEKYREHLAQTPGLWGAAGKATENAAEGVETLATGMERMTVALLAQNALFYDIAKAERAEQKVHRDLEASEKKAEKEKKEALAEIARKQEEAKKASLETRRYWIDTALKGKEFAGSIAGASFDLLKLGAKGGILGLLGLGGGLWGFEHLANVAASGRRASMGLDLTYGERAAFGVNMSRLVDPGSFLSAINQARHDVTMRTSLYGAGLSERDLKGMDTEQIAERALQGIKRLAERTPTGMEANTMQAFGIDKLMSLEDFIRAKTMSQEEFTRLIKQTRGDVGKMGLTPRQQEAFADFMTKLHQSGTIIETSFSRRLAELAGPLSRLSDGFTHAVTAFMESPAIGHWITVLGDNLEKFATYMGKPEFGQDIDRFVKNIGRLGDVIGNFIGLFAGKEENQKETSGMAAAATVGALAGAGIAGPTGAVIGGTMGVILGSGGPKAAWETETRSPWEILMNKPVHKEKPESTHHFLPPDIDRFNKMFKDDIIAPAGAAVPPEDQTGFPAPLNDNVPIKDKRSFSDILTGDRHNPGNLRAAPGAPTVGGFAAFPDEETGIRALARQLKRDEYIHHQNTLVQLIYGNAEWGGFTETKEDRAGYLKNLVKATGKGPNEKIDVNDPVFLSKLISAITKQEKGKDQYSPELVVTILNSPGSDITTQTKMVAR